MGKKSFMVSTDFVVDSVGALTSTRPLPSCKIQKLTSDLKAHQTNTPNKQTKQTHQICYFAMNFFVCTNVLLNKYKICVYANMLW